MSTLKGPRVKAASGRADSLIILLHGYGADGNDLIGLAQPMAPYLPNTVFRAPNAPQRCAVNPMGYQWFPIPWMDGSPESAMTEGIAAARATLHAYLDEAMAEEGMTADRTLLIGFSQGTMMALDVGLRRRAELAGIVGFSGRLVDDPAAGPATSKPPVLLVHGDQDEVVPVDSIHEARAALAAMEVSVRWHISAGIGHGIAPDGLKLALEFAIDRLGARASVA